jgi:hypothetical protein
MRIVAVSRVLDEADIIEAFVRHTASMVAHHVFMDNGSRDGTLDILRSLQHEGLSLSVFQNRCVSFNEANHLTFMFKQAVATHAADWVACLDVDEFLDNRQVGSSLAAILEKLENAYPDINCVKLPTVDYIATTQDDASEVIIPERIRKRRAVSDNYKAIVRGGAANGNVQIQSGGHGIAHADRPGTTVLQNELRLAHAVAASGLAHHYKNPYEALLDNPAELLRNNWFMGFKNETPDLIDDPIQYLGGALRYTRAQDEAMRAVQGLMGTLDALALRHGALLDDLPDAKQHVAALDSHHEKIF